MFLLGPQALILPYVFLLLVFAINFLFAKTTGNEEIASNQPVSNQITAPVQEFNLFQLHSLSSVDVHFYHSYKQNNVQQVAKHKYADMLPPPEFCFISSTNSIFSFQFSELFLSQSGGLRAPPAIC